MVAHRCPQHARQRWDGASVMADIGVGVLRLAARYARLAPTPAAARRCRAVWESCRERVAAVPWVSGACKQQAHQRGQYQGTRPPGSRVGRGGLRLVVMQAKGQGAMRAWAVQQVRES